MIEHPSAFFDYANRTGRPPGRLLHLLGRVHPGIRAVNAQVEPYAAAWAGHNRDAVRESGPRWVVLGDSMSQGIGATAWDTGWVGQLASRLRSRGHPLTVVNLSASGARVPDVIAQQLPALDAMPQSEGDAEPCADLVTVLIGSNDLFAKGYSEGLPDAFADLVSRLPDGAIVATLPQPRTAARDANRHIERAAATGVIEVVDLRTDGPDSWRGRLAADWFHPNDAGYAELARAFHDPVLARLSSRGPDRQAELPVGAAKSTAAASAVPAVRPGALCQDQ
ncbi:MAG: SGNH/GDSL hydrolase family protein [Ornithinibacter sp.]